MVKYLCSECGAVAEQGTDELGGEGALHCAAHPRAVIESVMEASESPTTYEIRRALEEPMLTYSYQTDAVRSTTSYESEAAAITAAVAAGDWAPRGSAREAREVRDGAYLLVRDSAGVPHVIAGELPR